MLQLKDLQERFNAHTEWHCYRNSRTGKTFARHKALKTPGPEIVKIGVANNACHMDALRLAKTK